MGNQIYQNMKLQVLSIIEQQKNTDIYINKQKFLKSENPKHEIRKSFISYPFPRGNFKAGSGFFFRLKGNHMLLFIGELNKDQTFERFNG